MELTKAQIERQDFVDNSIHDLLNKLFKDVQPFDNKAGWEIDWNIEHIAQVRDAVYNVLAGLGVDEFEFYPYLEKESGDYTSCLTCGARITWEHYGTNMGQCAECGEENKYG